MSMDVLAVYQLDVIVALRIQEQVPVCRRLFDSLVMQVVSLEPVILEVCVAADEL